MPRHGGQLRELAAQFQLPEDSLLDFSASINPRPPGDALVEALCDSLRARTIITQYPDIEYLELRKAIARYAGVDMASIVVGNGVMPLLAAALRALRIRSCLVLVPAFTEYRRTLAACDVECHTLVLREEDGFRVDCDRVFKQVKSTGAQALLIANPQSPSGTLMSAAEVGQLQETAANYGVATIVDEAFIDYVPEQSQSSGAAETNGLIVLRSVTKFFSMPGLRVAYAIVDPETRTGMETSMPSWPVDSIAAETTRLVLEDRGWAAAARESNAQERNWFAAELRALGLTVFPGAANFLLTRLNAKQDGLEFWRRLVVDHRIVVRSCANFEGLNQQCFRVGVRTRNENLRLLTAFSQMSKAPLRTRS